MAKLSSRTRVSPGRRLALGAGIVGLLGATAPVTSLADSCEQMRADANAIGEKAAAAPADLAGEERSRVADAVTVCAGPSEKWPTADEAKKLEAVVCESFPRHVARTKSPALEGRTAKMLEACAYVLSARVQFEWANYKKPDDEYDVEARYLYSRYRDLRSWSEERPKPAGAATPLNTDPGVQTALDLLGNGNSGRLGPARLRGVRDLMGSRGLRNGISALFVAGYLRPSLSSPGSPSAPGQVQAPPSDPLQGSDNASTPVTGHIVWSTRHWRGADAADSVARRRLDAVDFSLTGRFGLQPAVSLVKPESGVVPAPASGGGTAQPAGETTEGEGNDTQERAVIQDAFIWDLGPRVHVHLGENWQLEGMARAGQTHLTSDIVTLTSGNVAQVFVPLGGPGSSGVRWFYELGGTLRYTLQSLELLHEQNGLVEPAFELGFCKRKDDRLEATEKGQVVFADAWSRKVLRFAINGVPVGNAPGQKDNAKLFTVSFAVEHQWGGSLPSATAFSIRGNVDLIKALRGSGSKEIGQKQEAPDQAP